MRQLRIAALILSSLLGIAQISLAAAKDKVYTPEMVVPPSDRPVLAVVAFDDGAIHRQDWWGRRWDVGSGLADILTSTLLDRNRFRLLEWSQIRKVLAEQDLGSSGRVDPHTAVQAARIIGADYLIMGKVTDFSWETNRGGGLFLPERHRLFGLGISSTTAHVAVDLRIVDPTTSEILASFTGVGRESKGSFAVGLSRVGAFDIGSTDFMNSILGSATRKAMNDWVDQLCHGMDTGHLLLSPKHKAPDHPDGVVLDITDGVITANIGLLKGYMVGDRVEICRKGKVLKDPDTGEVLKVLTDRVATGQITKVEDKVAEITFTTKDGTEPPAEGDMVRYLDNN